MTMKELAKLANVSIATVSKAFCDADDVSEDTKNHIFDIAKETGCFGKYYKGKYSKKIIAIICPELKSNYYTCFVEELQSLIEKAGCMPVISTDGFSLAKQAELIEYYASFLKVDGILVFGMKCDLKKGYETPIVSLFSCEDSKVDSVDVSFESAMIEAVKLLTELGHRDIVFIGEKLTTGKETLYREIIRKYGKTPPVTVQSDYRFEKAGEDGISRLLSDNIPFTAVICAYDNIAFGTIKQLKRQGLKVPDDVSVIGMDNIHIGEYTETALTTIDTNPREVCMVAWNLLQTKLKNPYYLSRQNIEIGAGLVIRESTGIAK